jgi:hypothetical protein
MWAFRLERHDVDGNTLLPVIVEMRGTELVGDLKDGDAAETIDVWQPGEIHVTRGILNLSTGVTVRTRVIFHGNGYPLVTGETANAMG